METLDASGGNEFVPFMATAVVVVVVVVVTDEGSGGGGGGGGGNTADDDVLLVTLPFCKEEFWFKSEENGIALVPFGTVVRAIVEALTG